MTETEFRALLATYHPEVLAAFVADQMGLLGLPGRELTLERLDEARAALGRERSLIMADRLAAELERTRERGGRGTRLERGLDLLIPPRGERIDPRADLGYPGR